MALCRRPMRCLATSICSEVSVLTGITVTPPVIPNRKPRLPSRPRVFWLFCSEARLARDRVRRSP